MELALQLSLVTVTVCLALAAVLRRTPRSRSGIMVDRVSDTWLVEQRVRHRPD
jgi:hypothetical protein